MSVLIGLLTLQSVYPIIMRSIHHAGTLCARRDRQRSLSALSQGRIHNAGRQSSSEMRRHASRVALVDE
jgi:hypothetical protein